MSRAIIYPLFVILFSLILGCINEKSKEENSLTNSNNSLSERRKLYKDYALCKCLVNVTTDTALKNDISIAIYTDLTFYEFPALYKEIDSLAKLIALRIKPSQIADHNGKKPYMLSCIEFSKSNRLDSIIRKYNADLKKNAESHEEPK